MLIGRDCEDPERLPSEMLLVLFPFEAGLSKSIRSHHRHCAAVYLDHEIVTRAVCTHEPEHEIRHEPHFVVDAPMRERDAQREWIAGGDAPAHPWLA